MRRLLTVAAVSMAALTLVAAVESDRHSGSVVSVDPQAQTLVVQELGVTGRAETLVVKVRPGTNVVVSERDPRAADFGTRPVPATSAT